jgi:hypothetical protein
VTFQNAHLLQCYGQKPELKGSKEGVGGEEISSSLLAAKPRQEVGQEQDPMMAFAK